ncbi:MAG: putative DNA binding domain-containing protein [Bacteroidales bacterium]|nr:putative DNA binding domain-containing protein [Bacteroidales bacterium]
MASIKRFLKTLIGKGETREIEFKSAKGGFPASFWETYSAFANTDGGVIILGIKQKDNKFALDHMDEDTIKRYMNAFWDCVHNREKTNVCLPKESDIHVENIDGSYILVCEIPRAGYAIRPVYVGQNPFGHTYRRNSEGDYCCTDLEVRRMFADADHDRHPQDGRILVGYDFERDIDVETLHQFRRTFASLQPSHPWARLSNVDFLRKIGAYSTDLDTGTEGYTVAGILMFGKHESIINNAGLPTYFVDYREKIASDNPNVRWTNRIYPDGTWEANLYQFYIRVYNRLIQSLPRPFVLKNDIRQEETPAHDAVREALINCIVHQDINALGNIVVERTDNALTFANPGMMLVSKQQYFEGGHSVCRNPILQKMFMMLGRAEKAGSGVDKILGGWKYLGMPTPTVREQSRPDFVVLTMVVGEANQKGNQRTAEKLQREERILRFCEEEKSLTEIMGMLNLKDKGNTRKKYIEPLINDGRLALTRPSATKSKSQKYITVRNFEITKTH